MTLLELKQKLAALGAEHKKLFATAEGAGRDLTDDEKVRDDAIAAEVEGLQSDISRLERAQEIERATAAQQFDNLEDREIAADPAGTFADLGEFALAVYSANAPGGAVDPRLRIVNAGVDIGAAPTNFHQEGGSEDGYMVPQSMRDTIWELVLAEEGLINLVDSEPTASNSVQVIKDESTPWGATGVQAAWGGEGIKMDPARLETLMAQIRLSKIHAFVLATEELLEDAPRLTSRLTTRSAQAINFKVDEAIVNGDGNGKPRGWTVSDALVSVAKEVGQSADTVVAENVAKMFARLLPAGLSRAFWMVNSDIFPELMTMAIANRPIWTPPNGFIEAPAGLLLGRPIRLSEHAKTLGDKGDIQLIDPMGYYAATKASGIRAAESMHLFFDYDIRAFKFTTRVAGQPYLSGPVVPKYGAATKSHFVTLDERA
jgi:HK97 family phage major capsid protein